MKKTVIYAVVGIVLLTVLFFMPLEKTTDGLGLWSGATYTQDTEFGSGSKTLKVEVEVADKSVVFTVHTDKSTVGEALSEHNLISGEQGPYGMYVKYVNGIRADYDTDKSYWSFNKNGEYMATGVDKTEFADGDTYELVYTK